MSKKKNRPKQIDPGIVQTIGEKVETGKYRLYPSSNMPEDVPKAGDDCQALVIASDKIYSSDVPDLPPQMTPYGSVYLVRGFRTMKMGDPPRKVDDCLYYTSSDGTAWSWHSKDSSDHHNSVLSSTNMSGLINDWNLPSKFEGTLSEYRIEGATLDFYLVFGIQTDVSDDEES